MEMILVIVLLIVVAVLFMVVTEILYSVSAAILPTLALLMVVTGCVVGLLVAVKNTITVYWKIFFRRGT